MRQVFSGLRVMLCRPVFVLFVPFLCVIVLSVLLRFVAFDYLFGIYNILFTHTIKHTFSYAIGVTDRVMVFNAIFNNLSVISWRSVLLVEETGVPGENHRPAASQ